MNDLTIYRIALWTGCVFFAVLGAWIFRLSPEKLARWEKLPRNRWLGGVLGLLALLCCVPHARPIVWDWMGPHLVWMAFAGAAAGYWFLDYLFARATAGLMILLAYYYVHGAFEYHTPGAAFLSIALWLVGIVGIAISARPWYERDLIRVFCRKPLWRYVGAAFSLLTALALGLGGGLQK